MSRPGYHSATHQKAFVGSWTSHGGREGLHLWGHPLIQGYFNTLASSHAERLLAYLGYKKSWEVNLINYKISVPYRDQTYRSEKA